MNARARIFIGAVAIASALVFVFRANSDFPRARPVFSIPRASESIAFGPDHYSDFLPGIPGASSVHAPSLAESPDGTLHCLWWGGSREGARDVRLFLSRKSGATNAWSAPRAIMSRELAQRDLLRPIRRIGNGVIYAPGSNELRVIFVTTAIGGWSTASLNFIKSSDQGMTWSRAERLYISPLLNISELARSHPVPMADGSCLLPIYHELAGKFPELLWLRETGGGQLVARKTKAFGGRRAFQPSIAAVTESRAVMALRDPSGRTVYTTWTTDSGRTFSLPTRSDLPNPDAAVDVIALPPNRVLLAYNHSVDGRHNLSIAVSKDDGVTWGAPRTIEEEAGAEFSYPALHVGGDGVIHLAYTWKRQRIRYHTFSSGWIEQ